MLSLVQAIRYFTDTTRHAIPTGGTNSLGHGSQEEEMSYNMHGAP